MLVLGQVALPTYLRIFLLPFSQKKKILTKKNNRHIAIVEYLGETVFEKYVRPTTTVNLRVSEFYSECC